MPNSPALRISILAALLCAAQTAGAAVVAVQVADAAGKPVADVVVYADPDSGVLPKVQRGAEIEQKGLKFMPQVSVIQTGSVVAFPNNDKVRHHIYSFSAAKKFNQKLYSGEAASPQTFDKAGVIVLGCNIHDKMVAYVKVVDTPFFAKTDAAGRARLELPSAGKYTLRAWHFNMSAAAPAEQALQLKADDAAATFKLPMKPPVVESDSADYQY